MLVIVMGICSYRLKLRIELNELIDLIELNELNELIELIELSTKHNKLMHKSWRTKANSTTPASSHSPRLHLILFHHINVKGRQLPTHDGAANSVLWCLLVTTQSGACTPFYNLSCCILHLQHIRYPISCRMISHSNRPALELVTPIRFFYSKSAVSDLRGGCGSILQPQA